MATKREDVAGGALAPSVNKDADESPSYVQYVEELADVCTLLYSKVPGISLREFLRRSEQEEWSIVDVRSRWEQQVSIIPGALSVGEFEVSIDRHKNNQVLVYCVAGCQSGAYARKLRKRGLDAYSLWGGILAWALDGRPFVTLNEEPTRDVPISGKLREALPPGYRPIGRRRFRSRSPK